MNLKNMLSNEDLIKNRKKYKKVFFFRVCGTGMGACACLMKENGFDVHGADQNFYPPMSDYLKSTDIKLFDLNEVDGSFLKEYDLIIVGNSVPRVSDWSKMIEECGIPFTSFPSALGALVLKDKNVVGVAGTHGKTTTTFFLTQMLESLDVDTGYFIGGILGDRAPAKIGESDYFVIESDEYDSAYFQKFSKFRLYELNKMILTSLEFDHADIYNNVEEIEEQFESVLTQLDFIVADKSYDSVKKIEEKNKDLSWHLYSENSELGPNNIRQNKNESSFEVKIEDNTYCFTTNMIGLHNILNITACILFLAKEKFSIEDIRKAVKNLSLVKRRQEYRGLYKNSIVIDDFAHHPRAITLTIDAIKTKYTNKKIITIFEPVSATARSNIFQKEFTESLKNSDRVILAKSPMATTAKRGDNLDCYKISKDLEGICESAIVVENLNALREQIDSHTGEENLFLILSNRSCLGLWESDFVNEIS